MQNPYVGLGPLKARLQEFYDSGIFIKPSGMDGQAMPASSRVYGPTVKPEPSTRLADQERLDGESIQI